MISDKGKVNKFNKNILVLGLLFVILTAGFLLFTETDVLAFIKVDSNSSANISTGSLNKGLVGYWPLNGEHFNSSTGRVDDVSGYGNHGSNTGSTLTTGVGGKSEGAFNFDGNDWIDFGDLGNFGTGTISLWFSKNNTSTQYLLDGRGTGNWWFLTHYSDHDINFLHKVVYDGISTDNTWYHVVVTANSTETKMYLNGDLVDTGDGLSIDFRSVRAATRYTNSGYLSGRLSDIRIYNRVLSDDEVKTIYEQYKPSGGMSTSNLNRGLVLDMPLTLEYAKDDTKESEIMADKTPYGNDGTNNGVVIARGDNYASFDGSSSRVLIDTDPSLSPGTGDFTLSAWAKTDNTLDNDRIFSNHYLRWELWSGSGGEARSSIGDTSGRIVSYGPNIEDNKWHHVAATYDRDGDMTLYVDGVLEDQDDISSYSSVDLGSGSVTVGSHAGSTSYVWNGDISRVKMYKRALSQEEVESLYDKEKGLVGPDIVTDGLELCLDTNNPDSLESGADDSSTFYDIARGGDASFYTTSNMVDSSKKDRDEWVYYDGSGEYDGDPDGNHVVIDESLTRTDQSADGWTYFWVMKLTGSQPHGQRIFHGSGTIRHIEIKGEDTSSPSFRTEAAMDNGYSFGTGSVPGGSLIGEWNTFAIVWDNAASPRTVKWYKNGDLFYTDTNFDDGTGGTDEYFSFNRIGRSGGNASYQYTESLLGYLPVFMSYNRKLSETEVQANHNAFMDRFEIY